MKKIELIGNIIGKLLSGKYYLVLVAGGVFAYVACAGKLDPSDVLIVILLVFKDYFAKAEGVAEGKRPGGQEALGAEGRPPEGGTTNQDKP